MKTNRIDRRRFIESTAAVGMSVAASGVAAAAGQAAGTAQPELSGQRDIAAVDPAYFVPGRFAGQVVLITGGARGIGRATAIRAAREGASVVIADWLSKEGRETTDLIRAEGHKAHFVETDVRLSADCDRMVNEAVKTFGGLDAALNNAGVMNALKSDVPVDFDKHRHLLPAPVHLMTDEGFDPVFAVNAGGVFRSMRAELRRMVAQGRGGAIVNVGSIAAMTGLASNCAYNASKHAVSGLTRGAAIDYAHYGIRVNSVNMAGTDTPMTQAVAVFVAAAQKAGPVNRAGRLKTLSVLGAMDSQRRMATVWEQAGPILFLLSNDASNLTGGLYATDGGWTAF